MDVDAIYSDILMQTIELLWSQQAHVIRIKDRESRIRRKTRRSVPEMQTIIRELFSIIETELVLQADRYWTPKRSFHLEMRCKRLKNYMLINRPPFL